MFLVARVRSDFGPRPRREDGDHGSEFDNAFGGKRSRYRRALDHYVEQRFGDRVGRFEGRSPPREAIGAPFKEIIERSLSDAERRGCMLVNSALETTPARDHEI